MPMDGDVPRDDRRPAPDTDARDPNVTPKPDGESAPGRSFRWCVFSGAWCTGHDCFCELTLFA